MFLHFPCILFFQHCLYIKSQIIIIDKIALHSATVMFTIPWKRSSQLVHLIDLSLVFMMTSGSSCCAAIIVDIAHSRTHCYSAMPQHFKCKFLDHHNSFNKQNWGGQLYNVDQSLLFQKFGIYKIFQLSDSDECSKLFIVSFCLRAS